MNPVQEKDANSPFSGCRDDQAVQWKPKHNDRYNYIAGPSTIRDSVNMPTGATEWLSHLTDPLETPAE